MIDKCIRHKALRSDGGGWVEGALLPQKGKHGIIVVNYREIVIGERLCICADISEGDAFYVDVATAELISDERRDMEMSEKNNTARVTVEQAEVASIKQSGLMKQIGYYSLGLFGVSILDIEYDIDDRVVWCWSNDEKQENIQKSKIESQTEEDEVESRLYFMAGELQVFLDECLRTNIS